METPRHTLPRQQRLKSRTAINLLFGEGKRGYVFPIRFLYRIEKLNPGNVDSSTEDTLLNTEILSEKDATSQDTVNAEDFTIGTRNESQESTLAIETGQATISVKGSDRVIEGEQNCEMVTSPTDQPAADKSLNGTDIQQIFTDSDSTAAIECIGKSLIRLNPIKPEAAVMVSVPKRLHKRANVRNLLKRRMREAYRLNKEPLRELCTQHHIRLSIGLLYSSGEIADFHTIENAVRKIIFTIQESL